MTTLQPFDFWKNGQTVTAVNIDVIINHDNLENEATFYYALKDTFNNVVGEGNIKIDGEAYQGWQSNEDAYIYVCSKLNLKIIQ